jgi:hypothetical protein
VVAGAVLLDAEVSGELVDLGGSAATRRPDERRVLVNLDYHLPGNPTSR